MGGRAESEIDVSMMRMARMGVSEIERFEIGYHDHEEIDSSTMSAASPPPVAPGPRTANRFPGPAGPRKNIHLGPGTQDEYLLGPLGPRALGPGPPPPHNSQEALNQLPPISSCMKKIM